MVAAVGDKEEKNTFFRWQKGRFPTRENDECKLLAKKVRMVVHQREKMQKRTLVSVLNAKPRSQILSFGAFVLTLPTI